MSAPLKEESLSSVSDKHDPKQATFTQFGSEKNQTTIAVVSLPNEKMLEVTDEWVPELGIPEKHLSRFLKRKKDYRANSAIDEPANRAYTDLSLDEKYVEYVRESEDAQDAISQIISRINSGESITLVSYEEPHEMCHRHTLMEIIQNRVKSEFTFSKPIAL